jgi:S1-C subfamily serine protease
MFHRVGFFSGSEQHRHNGLLIGTQRSAYAGDASDQKIFALPSDLASKTVRQVFCVRESPSLLWRLPTLR